MEVTSAAAAAAAVGSVVEVSKSASMRDKTPAVVHTTYSASIAGLHTLKRERGHCVERRVERVTSEQTAVAQVE